MPPNPLQVIIADDNDFVRMSLALALTSFINLEAELIAEARDMTEGIALCLEYTPDVMLLDVRIRPGNSVEFITLLKEHGCPTKIILLAGSGDENLVETSFHLGASAWLSRECTLDEIEQTISAVTGSGDV